MSELLEVIQSGKFILNNLNCEFEAHYEDYTIYGSIDCEVEKSEEKDEDIGIMRDSYLLQSVDFWYIRVQDENSEKISLTKEEETSVKQDIENFFDVKVQSF
jgi:hypothetical protein